MKEKRILNDISTLEASIKREIIETKYYSEFVMNTRQGPITLNNVFITSELDKNNGISYHFRWINEDKNGEKTIVENIVIDKDGKAYVPEFLKEYLGNAVIEIDELFEENDDIKKDRIKAISKEAKKEELNQIDNEELAEEELIEEELVEQGQELEITKCRKIKDTHISERIPEVFEHSTENYTAYSNKLHRYVLISKINGQYQLNENVEPAKLTWKSIISIEPNGERVERKVPYAMMKTNQENKEIAVILDPYGDIDIETVDVLPCQERISRKVRSEGQGQEKQEEYEIRNQFEQEGKEYKHKIAHQVQNIEQAQRDENKTVDYDITPDDYIPNTKITWKELMEETGDTLPKLIERYQREMSIIGTKSEDAVKTIEYDYENVNREHTIKN